MAASCSGRSAGQPRRVDDVVLQRRVQPLEGALIGSSRRRASMSSADAACRSTSVSSPSVTVSA